MLLKEHRFTFVAGVEIHLFRIEELVGGVAFWPQRFRLQLPASCRREAKTIYGEDCDEVAQEAADVMARESTREGRVETQGMSPVRRDSAPQTLQIQE
jgi:hypothetical protein